MDIREVRLVYFSPTRTTQKVLEGIARGIPGAVAHVDLTSPTATTDGPPEREDGLAVIGSPVYGGRLPLDAVSRLRRREGRHTPAVVVVVYGNRAYEDALLDDRRQDDGRSADPGGRALAELELPEAEGARDVPVGRAAGP